MDENARGKSENRVNAEAIEPVIEAFFKTAEAKGLTTSETSLAATEILFRIAVAHGVEIEALTKHCADYWSGRELFYIAEKAGNPI